MLEVVSKGFFSGLAASAPLKRFASRYGMRRPGSFARRFIAGETLEEAIAAARAIEQTGLTVTLDMLGESVDSTEAAGAATASYVGMIAAVRAAGISRNLSIKLTQLGLSIDRATAFDNLRRILDAASAADVFVRIDMEGSAYTASTLDTFNLAWQSGYRNAGIVVQSYLRRTADDVKTLLQMGARMRLVKGAYREPKQVAFQDKREVDTSFVDLMKKLLAEGNYPAIATHDPAMIEPTRAFAAERGLAKDRFEFQMLYGIRRDLQAQLAREGYPFRVYVPFGTEWFPYFMRRLGERPANVGFVLRSLFRDR